MKVTICRTKINSIKHGFTILGKVLCFVIVGGFITTVGLLVMQFNINDLAIYFVNYIGLGSEITLDTLNIIVGLTISIFLIGGFIFMMNAVPMAFNFFNKRIQVKIKENC